MIPGQSPPPKSDMETFTAFLAFPQTSFVQLNFAPKQKVSAVKTQDCRDAGTERSLILIVSLRPQGSSIKENFTARSYKIHVFFFPFLYNNTNNLGIYYFMAIRGCSQKGFVWGWGGVWGENAEDLRVLSQGEFV